MKKLVALLVLILTIPACSTLEHNEGKLRHVVSFKFKPDATEQQVAALIEGFEGLQNEIPQILSFEWGLNNSPEGFDRGRTHVFLLTFENERARDEYLPHPAHKAFGDTHGGIIEALVVVDYTINQ